MSNDKKTARKGLLWGTFGKIINAILKFVSVPLLLNYFGEADYGLIVLALSINVYLGIMELGFNTGNIRFISQWLAEGKDQKIYRLIKSSLFFYGIVGVLNFLILIIMSIYCQEIFDLSDSRTIIFKDLLLIIGVSGFFSWFYAVTSQVLIAYKRLDYDEKLKLLSNILVFTGVIFTVTFDLSIVEYFIFYAVALLIPIPLKVLKIRSIDMEIRFFPNWDKDIFNEVLNYSLGIFSMGFFRMSIMNLRPIILGIQGTLSEVSQFKIIEQIVMVIILLTSTFSAVLLPYATKYRSENNIEAQKKMAYSVTKYLSIFLVLLVFGLISISQPLLEVYIGKEFTELSIWLNIWALTILGSHNAAISSMILAGSDIKPIIYFTAFSATVSLAAAWFSAPVYGIGGVVCSYSLYVILQLSFYYFYYIPFVMKFNAGQIFIKSFTYPLFIGLISYFLIDFSIMIFQFKNPYVLILAQGIGFTVLYCLLTLLTTLKPKEIKTLIV